MSTGLDESLRDQLDRFLSDREIFKVHCETDDWQTWRLQNIAAFPADSSGEWVDLATEIDVGDILIAQDYRGGKAHTFGFGVVSTSFSAKQDTQAFDIDESSEATAEAPQIDVNWTVVANNGEHIQQGGPDEFPPEIIAKVDREFFDALLAAFDSGSFPPPGEDLVEGLFNSNKLRFVDDIAESHLPLGDDAPASIDEQIKTVVRKFFAETDVSGSTEERREDALSRSTIVIDLEKEAIEANIVSHLREGDVDGDEDYLSKHFDPALERMNDAWNTGEPWETAYSTSGDADLFFMPVNDRWIPDFKRTVDQRFEPVGSEVPEALADLGQVRIWGSRGGDRNAGTFESLSEDDVVLYYRNGAIIARGRVGSKFEGEEYGDFIWDNPESKFVYTLKEYTPLAIPAKTMWDKLDYEDNFSPQGFSRVYPDRTDRIRPEDDDLWSVFNPYVVTELIDGSGEIPDPEPAFNFSSWLQESLAGEYEYFILKTGNDDYEDEPASSYHFKEGIPGCDQLPSAAPDVRFVYLEDGEFYAVGSIGEITTEDVDGTEHYYAEVTEYHEIDPISLTEVRDQLTRDFPIQFGIINIEQSDFEAIFDEQRSRDTMAAINELLTEEAGQAWLYRESLAHLVAGKNLVFYGPPGTGKTRAARKLSTAVCAGDYSLVTANAEWSNYQVVGGYAPSGDGFKPQKGFLTEAAADCQDTLTQSTGGHPSWLLIDELNRANLDEAFGDIFTLLDIDYRTSREISYAPDAADVPVPLSFRILATMNTYDQAQLFSLGYAFRRRFAFVRVPSLMDSGSQAPPTSEPTADPSPAELTSGSETTLEVVRETLMDDLLLGSDDGNGVSSTDVAAVLGDVVTRDRIEEAIASLEDSDALRTGSLDWLETIVYFAQEVMDRDVIDIGQALLIDAGKYVVAHQVLFPDETDRSVLDQAVISYLVPQFEHFMPELRRADTIDQDSTASEDFDEIIDLANQLGLPETASVLTTAKEDKRVLE